LADSSPMLLATPGQKQPLKFAGSSPTQKKLSRENTVNHQASSGDVIRSRPARSHRLAACYRVQNYARFWILLKSGESQQLIVLQQFQSAIEIEQFDLLGNQQ
jgi:hypothetical protein